MFGQDFNMNGRSFFKDSEAESTLEPLLDLLGTLEQAANQAAQATMADPAALKANSAAFAAFGEVCKPLPEWRVEVQATAVDQTADGLGSTFPDALLAATRLGWATAAGSLLPIAVARGGNPMTIGTEIASLQAALYAEPAPKLAPTPRTLIATEQAGRLWRLSEGDGTPTVVVASLINRFYLMDLLEGQSLLSQLPGPLYLVDWTVGEANLEQTLTTLETLLERFETVKLVGYSMGGTLAAVHTARNPDRIERLAVFAAPIDMSRGGKFQTWSEHADFDAVSSAYQAVPAPWVHAPFWALRPTVNLAKLTQLVRRWREPGYLERFLAVELWNNDNVDVSGPIYRDWGTVLYKDNALWTGELAKLGDISCPTLAIAAKHDGIVPTECTLALAEQTGGETITIPSGHVGALSGRKGLAALTEALTSFLGGAK
jgi:pimeloyl-ACP methyl ester carboxylesterase